MKYSAHIGRFLLATFGLMALWLTACEKDNPIQGFELANATGRGKIESTVIDKPELEATGKGEVTPTGLSPYLLLGAFDDLEARILIRFNNLPDSVKADKATLILIPRLTVGDSVGSFLATAHRVTQNWSEDSVTVATFGDAFDPEPVSEAEVFAISTDTTFGKVEFELDTQLVNAWIDSTVPNYGLLINFSATGFIKEFFSSESNDNRPKLELISTSQDTSELVATADAFLVKSFADLPEGPLYVDNSFFHRTVLKFDLSSIPRAATINRAELVLTIRPSNSLLTSDGLSLNVLRLTEPFESFETLRADSGFVFTATVKESLATVNVGLRRLVQAWTLQNIDNDGLIIQARTPGRDVSRAAFFSAALDSSSAPRLQIDFTVPPEGP